MIETSTEPTEQLGLEAFLAQAAIVAAIADAAGELSLSEAPPLTSCARWWRFIQAPRSS